MLSEKCVNRSGYSVHGRGHPVSTCFDLSVSKAFIVKTQPSYLDFMHCSAGFLCPKVRVIFENKTNDMTLIFQQANIHLYIKCQFSLYLVKFSLVS